MKKTILTLALLLPLTFAHANDVYDEKGKAEVVAQWLKNGKDIKKVKTLCANVQFEYNQIYDYQSLPALCSYHLLQQNPTIKAIQFIENHYERNDKNEIGLAAQEMLIWNKTTNPKDIQNAFQLAFNNNVENAKNKQKESKFFKLNGKKTELISITHKVRFIK